MGRRKSFVYSHWKEGNDSRVSCRYCNHTILANSTRMEQHLRKDCLSVPEPVKSKFVTEAPSSSITITPPRFKQTLLFPCSSPSTPSNSNFSSTSSPNVPSPKRMRCNDDDEYHDSAEETVLGEKTYNTQQLDHMTNQQKIVANRKLAGFIFGCNIPFSVVDHPHFREFIRFLRPAYEKVMPHRMTISNRLLEEEYGIAQKKVHAYLSTATAITYCADGWQSLQKNPVIAEVLCTPTPILIRSERIGPEKKDAEYHVGRMERTLEMLQESQNGFQGMDSVDALCTDSPNVMLKFRNIIKLKYPWIFAYGCAPHALHNLCRDILHDIDEDGTTIKQAQMVNRFWLEHTAAKQVLAKALVASGKSRLSPPLVGETRWGSSLRVLEFITESRREMLVALLDPIVERIKGNLIVKETLQSDRFIETCFTLAHVLQPIVKGCFLLESSCGNIASVIPLFRKLRDYVQTGCYSVSAEKKAAILTHIQRREEVCADDCHCLATALHPRYGATYLDRLQTERAMAAMELLADRLHLNLGDLYHDYGLFTVRGGDFRMEKAESAIDHMSASVWWTAFHGNTALSKVAARVTSFTATVASVDRVFKDHTRQITHDRNRLDENKAGKLALITGMYRIEEGCDVASKPEPNVTLLFDSIDLCEALDGWHSNIDDPEDEQEMPSASDDIESVCSEEL